MASVNTMQQFMMNQLVTRDQLESYHKAQSEELKEYVQEKVQEKVAPVEGRMGQIEERVSALEQSNGRPWFDPTDPAHKRVAVLGVPVDVDADVRIQVIEQWFKEKFPNTRILDVGNFYTGEYGKQSITKTSYVEFSNSYVRNSVLSTLERNKGNSAWKFQEWEGTKCDIKKALTQSALQRNGVLKAAEKLLKQDSRVKGEVKGQFGSKDRGVLVDKKLVFVQPADSLGHFVAPFADLRLPERKNKR